MEEATAAFQKAAESKAAYAFGLVDPSGAVIVDSSPKFLRVAMEKFGDDSHVGSASRGDS